MSALSMRSFIIVSVRSPIFAAFMTNVKRFPRAAVSFILLAAAFFFIPQSASATGLDMAAGAVLDGALSALSVQLGISAGASLTTFDLIQSVISGDPLGVTVDYTNNQSLADILSQEIIKIRKGSVTIDGIEYSDVWLPHDAADKFRVNAFDFITHYNILTESNGTYVSGVGYAGGIPMFSSGDGHRRSQTVVMSSGTQWGPYHYANGVFYYTDPDTGHVTSWTNAYPTHPLPWQLYLADYHGDSAFNQLFRKDADDRTFTSSGYNAPSFVSQPFDFTWVAGTIPAEPLLSSQGLTIRIPSSYVSSIPAVVSPDLADYVTLIGDLSNALEQARLADAVESTAFEEYDAPVPPVPSTGTIAEEPYTSLDGSLNGIQDSLDNIDTNIGTVDESLDDIQVYAEDAAGSLHSIDTNLSQSVADTAGIKGFIQQYLPGVHSLLNSISTSVSNIAGSVAAADETFFGNVVDAIVAPFTPVFDIFKAGVGIWRYVVAWVGHISAPFSWIWSTLSHANGILVSPILASAAAAVVLAVYKRFGR